MGFTWPDRSIASDERGQTLIDYQIGISVFLIAVAFVFLFLPSVFAPHTAPVDASQTEQGDRVATEVLEAVTLANATNTLDSNATEDFFDDSSSLEAVPVSTGASVNVTLVDGYGEPQASVGEPHEGESTAATTRIVTDEPGADPHCPGTETCRLEVRVWR